MRIDTNLINKFLRVKPSYHHFFKLSLAFLLGPQGSTPAATIAYLYALEEDNKAFIDEGAVLVRTEALGDRTIRTYRLGDHTVIGTLLASGQAESAVSAGLVLARRSVDAVISTGVVGALDDTFKVGDTLVITSILGWQVGSFGATGWSETPRTRPAVTRWNPWQSGALPWPEAGTASGDVFVANETERARLNGLTDMPVVEMNLFGLQTAINALHRPSLHLRKVSDLAGDDASEEFRAFAGSYRGELGREVARLIKALPEDLESPAAYPALKALERP